jgi:hypothetical protein
MMEQLTYHEKLLAVKEWAEDNIDSVEGFAVMFDITLEDMLKCFPDAMVKGYKKVFVTEGDDNDFINDDEEEAWGGFSLDEES